MRYYRRRRGVRPLPAMFAGPYLLPLLSLLSLLCLLLMASLTIWGNSPIPTARADGGAPNLAYIIGGGEKGDQLVVMDIAQRRVDWTVSLSQPQGIVLSADGRFAYIPEASANRVAIVDTRARQVVGSMPVGSGPQAIATNPTSGLHALFVANTNENSLTVLDADTRHTRATLAVGREPVAVAVATATSGISAAGDASSSEVYVANRASQSLSVIATSDTSEPRLVATIALSAPPCALTIPGTGGVAYVATCSGSVLVVGLARRQVLGTLFSGLGGAPGQIDYDAVTGQIYVPVPARDQVVILRPGGVGADGKLAAPREPLRTLNYTGAPSAVAITFDGALGFVAGRGNGQVAEFDVATRATLGTVAVGGAPRAIVTGPYPPALNRETANTVTALIYGALAVAVAIFVVIMVRKNIRDNIQRSRRSE